MIYLDYLQSQETKEEEALLFHDPYKVLKILGRYGFSRHRNNQLYWKRSVFFMVTAVALELDEDPFMIFNSYYWDFFT